MKKNPKTREQLLAENDDLRRRLEEAEDTLRAIHEGEVDALVLSKPQGDVVFTLKGAEQPYRIFVEAMNEGAATLDPEGTILYCNNRFADMLKIPADKVIGSSFHRFIPPEDRSGFESAFQGGNQQDTTVDISLKREDQEVIPVHLSLNMLHGQEMPVVCMVVTDLTEHMAKDKVLRESEERLRDLSSRLLTAHEEERKRIAHEIHDSLGSSLGVIKFKAEKLLGRIGKSDDVDDLIRTIQGTAEEVRRIQSALHPPLLDDVGILATINWFTREFQKASGIRIEKRLDIEEKDIPVSTRIVIYRIAQEALNNAAKHSQADLIEFRLRKADRIELLIRDNGKGFDLNRKVSEDGSRKGIGLSSMRERAELSGGSFTVESSIGKGTAILASWPI